MKEQILKLLGANQTAAVVAMAVGCTESYVSQLMADEKFAAEVHALRVKSLQAASVRDDKMDAIEDMLLEQLETIVPFITKPNEILNATKIVNSLRRRGAGAAPVSAGAGAPAAGAVVRLVLPEMPAKIEYKTNGANEVIEVAGRTMATLPAELLTKMAAEYTANQRRVTVENGSNVPVK